MKPFLTIVFILSSLSLTTKTEDYVKQWGDGIAVVQYNAVFNKTNSVKNLGRLSDARVFNAWIDEHPKLKEIGKKAKEISQDTIVGPSLQTIGVIIAGVGVVTLGHFDLQAGIDEAKELPVSVIRRTEYDLKDELIRETIMNTQTDVGDIKKQLDKIENRLFEMK